MTQHICTQAVFIDRHESELYRGAQGRKPVLGRLDENELSIRRLEKIANGFAAFGVSILLATTIAAGATIYKTVQAADRIQQTLSNLYQTKK